MINRKQLESCGIDKNLLEFAMNQIYVTQLEQFTFNLFFFPSFSWLLVIYSR